jgi:glutathione synthase/RimK-type ligase-like ATP-grasp enzyme
VAPGNRLKSVADRTKRLAVLVSPTDLLSPSSLSSLKHFSAVAAGVGVETALIGESDLSRLPEFDGLFIRQTTSVGGVAHCFALRARSIGLPVLDDPDSIVYGSNKIIQHRLFVARRIEVARTMIASARGAIREAACRFGLPLVLKIPDGSYCRGVEKAETLSQAEEIGVRLLAFSKEILLQEYLPTPFDWRIGVLDGAPLFACKYHMVPGHWQVVARGLKGSFVNGPVEPVPLRQVPDGIIESALRAAGCVGRGLYGVDIKATSRGPVVIEVNDNPDMDDDVETGANPEAWQRLAEWFKAAMSAVGCGLPTVVSSAVP